ncbi:hypothetical protein F5884DRAFT_26915 [Xylogone sp. PMI_703]|nr:hypothetical protein F5884DRAFT_26915 [Xylogone sp. PMI_703]
MVYIRLHFITHALLQLTYPNSPFSVVHFQLSPVLSQYLFIRTTAFILPMPFPLLNSTIYLHGNMGFTPDGRRLDIPQCGNLSNLIDTMVENNYDGIEPILTSIKERNEELRQSGTSMIADTTPSSSRTTSPDLSSDTSLDDDESSLGRGEHLMACGICTHSSIINIELGHSPSGRPVVYREVLSAFSEGMSEISVLDEFRYDKVVDALQNLSGKNSAFKFNKGRDNLRYIDWEGTSRPVGNQRNFRVALTDMYAHQGMRELYFTIHRNAIKGKGGKKKQKQSQSAEASNAAQAPALEDKPSTPNAVSPESPATAVSDNEE